MIPWSLDLRSLAVDSSLGRGAYVVSQLARATTAPRGYSRASSLLSAWRATESARVASYVRHRVVNAHDLGEVPLAENLLLQTFVHSPVARQVRSVYAGYPPADAVRLREPRDQDDPQRQGDLIVLKSYAAGTGEKGVLLLKYTESFRRFAAVYRVEDIVRHYMVVLEPSWWGYQDADFLLLAGSDADVVVQAPSGRDFKFLSDIDVGLHPIRIGAGDWIDPELFLPGDGEKTFDVVMVSSWNPFKRHRDLFRAMAEVRDRNGLRLRAALVGYPNGWEAGTIRSMISQFQLDGQCEVFDSVPQSEVARIVAASRLYVLLSRREGANKAMYEAMFCDTPVLVDAEHLGVNHDHLVSETGRVFRRGHLAEGIQRALSARSYSPRAWALEHTGYTRASSILDDSLRELAARRGTPWTAGVAVKKNEPNLRYADPKDTERFDQEYVRLGAYLRDLRS